MKQHLDDQLCEAFPNIFRDRHASKKETAMCWGFNCGDGWFNILYELAGQLEDLTEEHPNLRARQVKEKFGMLRFYVSEYNDEIRTYIREAEEKSSITCEVCGGPGTLRGREDGRVWIKTLCEEHKHMSHREIEDIPPLEEQLKRVKEME